MSKELFNKVIDKLNKFVGTSKFASVETEAGTLVYEGELAQGTVVTIEVDGEPQPAPEGDHVVTEGEMEGVTITLDADGIVTAVSDAMEAEEEEEFEELTPKEVMAAFSLVNQKNQELSKEIETIKEEKEDLRKRLTALEKYADEPAEGPTKKKFSKDEGSEQPKGEANANPFGLNDVNPIYFTKVKDN